MIKHFDIQDNHLIEVTEAPGKVWVVTKPDEAEKEQLKTQYRLDDYNMNSMLDPDEVPDDVGLELVGVAPPKVTAIRSDRPRAVSAGTDWAVTTQSS